jgi:hypothetical protein
MDEVAAWVENKIRVCAPREGVAPSPEDVRSLLSACAALKGRGGTLFGMMYPQAGLADAPVLYRLACDTLQLQLNALEDETFKQQVAEVIRRNELDVAVVVDALPAGGRAPLSIDMQAAKTRPDRIGQIAKVVGALKAVPIVPHHCHVSEIPPSEELQKALAELGVVPPELRTFLSTMPSRFDLEWSDDEGDANGFVAYELAHVPEIYNRCTRQVRDWLDGLEHYYRVWADSTAFMEVGNGAGFVAVHKDGSVRYLDDQGNTHINGWRLGGSLEEFWSSWCSLGFIAIHPDTLSEVTDENGISAQSVRGTRMADRLR